jgi:putative ABC transport system permease protein
VAEIRELAAMARAGDEARLVELKVVGPGYPLYGGPVTDPARPLTELVGAGRALAHESLLGRLGLRVGDRVRIGEGEFTISGRVVAEPDRGTGVFSLGPRVIIAAADLPGTRLIQPGSRVRHRTLLRVPEGRTVAFAQRLSARARHGVGLSETAPVAFTPVSCSDGYSLSPDRVRDTIQELGPGKPPKESGVQNVKQHLLYSF